MLDAPTLTALAGALLGLWWIAYLLRFHRAGRAFPELHAGSHPAAPPGEAGPSLSVIVAAKDEEAAVERCVRSLVAQDVADLEVVVVDDRSVDATPRVLERLRQELAPRLTIVSVRELPPGWGGQCHALHEGVRASRGEWLCFTDADCRLEAPRALTVAWREARASGAELLSVLPRMEAPTAWERVYLPLCSFTLLVHLRIAAVNDPADPAGYANGAFLLVRRAAYERQGGHARVRGLVNDDVALARLAKREGVAVRVASTRDLVRTRMYSTARAAFAGWTRNFYGTLCSAAALSRALLATLALFVAPWPALLACLALAAREPAWRPAALAWALPVLVSHLGLWRLYGACGLPARASLAYLPGALFVAAILARAALRAARRAGTTWHGVHYAHPVLPEPATAGRPPVAS